MIPLRLSLWALPAALAALFSGGHRAIDPGAQDGLSAEACVKCHAEVVEEWKASGHGRAWVDPIFQREWQVERQPWCVHCHAPLVAQHDEVKKGGGPLAGEGVTCAACHLRDGKMISTRRAPRSPHDTIAIAGFDGPGLCAGCHQFPFPRLDENGEHVADTPHPMQHTVAQFLTGPFKNDRCLDCHGAGAHGHRFPGGHDLAMLQYAVKMSACRDGAKAIEIAVENRGAGHNVPTGDVHRHLVARAWRSTAPERMAELFLGRRFEPADDGGKRATLDTTLAPRAKRRLRVGLAELGGDPDEPINLELRYVYTIDEFPVPAKALPVPTWVTVSSERVGVRELRACGGKR